jgi:uncharacterized protein YndB with AHSA1/START domain
MDDQTLVHASFEVERSFSISVDRLYQAFADKTAKELWFKGPNGTPGEHTMDFRAGGQETNLVSMGDTKIRFEARYYDVIQNERIVYVYEMYLNEKRISVSLASLEFSTKNDKAHLRLVEDGIFLETSDGVESRERGTKDLMEALAKSIE